MNDKFIGTTVAKKATVKLLDDGNYLLEDKDIDIKTGIEINNAKEYQKLGTYTIPKPDTEEVSGNTSFTGYDYMKKFDTPYVDSNTYPIRLDACLENLCSQVGLVLGNKNFPNNSYMLKGNPFTNRETRKTVLSNLVQLTGGFAEIDIEDGKLYVRNLDVSGEAIETIDGNNYDEFKPNNVFGPVNSVRIQMNSGVDGEETIKEAEGVTDENRCQITIADNYYLTSAEEREAVINGIFNVLNGLTYLPIELSYYGYPWLKLGDKIKVKDKSDKEYVTYVMEHTLKYNGAYSGTIKAIALTKTQQAYKEVLSLKDWRRNTELAVDKINGKMTAVIEEQSEQGEKLTKTEQDVNGLTTKVSSVEQSVENITNTQNTATGKNIHLEDSSDETLVSIKVKGETSQVTRSGKNLFNASKIPSSTGIVVTDNGKTITMPVITAGNGYTSTSRKLSDLCPNLKVGDIVTLRFNRNLGIGKRKIIYLSGVNYTWYATVSLTTTQEMLDSTVVLYGNTYNEGETEQWILTDFSIMLSSETDTSWEQYGASPSPDYPSEIENVEGKNKFNKNTVTDNYLINKNDGTLNANASYCVSDYIDVQGISKITLTNFNVYYSAFYDKDKKFLSSSESTSTINVPNNAKYFRSSLLKTNKDIAQLEEGTIATPYVPYNSLEIKDIGENLFDCANSKIIYNNSNTSYERLDNGLKLISSGGQYNMIYFLVDTVENLKGKTLTLSSDILFSKEKQYVSFGLYYTDFNSGNRESFGPIESIKTEGYYTIKGIVEEGENRDYVCIGLRPNMDSNFAKGDYTIYDNLQVEIGETATPYKPYQEQKVTFPLESQKLMKGSYLASDGIHHKRAQKTVTIQGIAVLPNGNIGGTFQPGRKKYSLDNGLCCDKAKHDPNRRFVTDTVYENEKNIVFVGDSTDTLETLKEKYDGAILEYLLAEEEIVPYTEEQQEAWNKIEQLHTYKNVTNIFSDAELDIVYVRDNGLSDMYETKQNAERNYTKTTEKLAEQEITTDSIQQNVSKTETIVANNYKELKTKFDDYAPKSDVITLQNSVEKIQTDTYTKTEINTKLTDGSVTKVTTTCGTFDENGLTIEKTNAKTKGNFNEKGMKVVDATGSSEEILLFAGYDKETDETIVKSKNMTVEKYLTIGANCRFEDYVNPVLGGKGTGAFTL